MHDRGGGHQRVIVVSGATGRQGGTVARRLLHSGWRVRALTRRPSGGPASRLRESGAEVVTADLEDPAALRRALDGAYGVFSVQNFWEHGASAEIRQGKNLVEVAQETGVGHFVYSSVGCADQDATARIEHFASKAAIERHLRGSEIPYTILRPVTFFENLCTPAFARSIVRRGILRFPFPSDRLFQMVALEDLATFVEKAFADPPRFAGQTLEIASDELTMADLARALGEAAGRSVVFRELPMPVFNALTLAIACSRQSHRFHLGRSAYRQICWNRASPRGGWSADLPALRAIHPGLLTVRSWARSVQWDCLPGV